MTLSSTVHRAFALGIPNGELLIRDSEQRVSFRALALEFSYKELLIRDSEQQVSFRTSALKLPNRELLYVTLKSTFRLGR